MGIQSNYQGRAEAWFARSEHSIETSLSAMMGNHAAKGRLQSGMTIIRAIEIFEEQTSVALRNGLEEAAKNIDHRGRRWSKAMTGIEIALDGHLASARRILAKPLDIADKPKTPSVQNAADERIAGTNARLREQFEEFRDGWTAPIAKAWKDRQPFLYAVGLVIVGAIVGEIVKRAFGL